MISKVNMVADGLAKMKTVQPSGSSTGGFGQLMKNEVGNLVDVMSKAEAQGINSLAGQSDINSLVTSLTDSRLAFKALLGFRREFMQAWNELRQMQI